MPVRMDMISRPFRTRGTLTITTLKYCLLVAGGILAILPFNVLYAADTPVGTDGQPDSVLDRTTSRFFSLVDKEQEMAVDKLTGLTNRVDSFFSNERVYYDATDSFVRIRGDTIWDEEADHLGFTGDVRVKLDLKRTSEKYKFVIESNPERGEADLDQDTRETPLEAAQQPSYYAGLQAQAGDRTRWFYRSTLGVRIKAPLDVFIRLHANRTYPLDDWSLRLDEGLFHFSSFGLGADSAAEFDHALDSNSLFRARSYVRWLREDDNFNVSEVVSLFHTLSPRRWLGYQAGVYAPTRPSFSVSDYLLLLRYRQDIHKHFLFMEIIPQIRYQKINNFSPQHSITFRLEWLVG